MSWSWFTPPRFLALAAAALGTVAARPALDGRPWSGTVGSTEGLTWSWRLDVVACVLLAFVGVLTWLVARFCAVNLRGRARGTDVGILLTGVLMSLVVMAASAGIVGFAVGWTTSGLLVTLLIARAGTERAGDAARVMRRWLLLGDAALWTAVAFWAVWFPTTERGSLLVVTSGWHATVVAALLTVACVARSGLVPAHRWLPETAEAPSPVSALLHAGVVNGAGLLAVAAWPVFAAAPAVLATLLVVGLLTVITGAWAGTVRRDVKGRLAWSTTTQMGYMAVQVGLGLPAMALMHLIAHGFYKSWLFLRAGGAAERHRHRWATVRRPGLRAGATLASLVVLATVGAPAATAVLATSGLTAAVPLLVAATAVALAGWCAAGLARTTTPVVLAVAALAGLAGAAYAWLLRGWELLVSPAVSAPPLWGQGVALGLVGACVVTGLLLLRGRAALARAPWGPLAVRLLPLSLSPGRRLRATAPAPLVPAAVGAAAPAPAPRERERVVAAALRAAATTGPAWPVGAMVAANPLAALERLPFAEAVAVAEQTHGGPVRPALDHFLALHDSGRIRDAHLARALEDEPELSSDVEALLAETRRLAEGARAGDLSRVRDVNPVRDVNRVHRRLRHLLPGSSDRRARLVLEHEGIWSQLAWSDSVTAPATTQGSRAKGVAQGPYTLWRTAAASRGYDRASGLRGASAWVGSLPADPAAAMLALASVLGLRGAALEDYLRAMVADGPGWTAHAMWRGRETGDPGPLLELLALRMAHDVLFCWTGSQDHGLEERAPAAPATPNTPTTPGTPDTPDTPATPTRELTVALAWQRALELGVQDWLLGAIDHARPLSAVDATSARPRPASQSLWCIDVRSERIRRHLESIGRHETFGFAGFFGAAVRLTDPDGNTEDLCPVLLRPDHSARVDAPSLGLAAAVHRTATSVSRHPLAALVVAEGGGLLSGLNSLASTLLPAPTRRAVRRHTTHGARAAGQDERRAAGRAARAAGKAPRAAGKDSGRERLHTDLTVDERTDLAHSALVATGLVADFAPVLLVCGHGATVENNAFAAAYDCGACGGHPGGVSAVLLAGALNDPEVRRGLARRGIELPADTVAVPALHDTSTDRVELLEPVDDPDLVRDLEVAGARAAHERLRSLPPRRRRETARGLARRASDWSEPAPEWGLSGNAALVIGPRALTRGAGLDGRVFLHSYDSRLDPDGVVLEQLLTAPLVVAQWINAQYYFSAAAPHLYGAGDKTTHNVVGDVGVLTGARGDLRTGLPWQALSRTDPTRRQAHDPVHDLVHEPVRLTVVVAAPPEAVARTIGRHEDLHQLVAGDWITVLVTTPDGRHLVLGPDLQWRERSSGRTTAPPAHPVDSTPPVLAHDIRTTTTKESR